MEEEDFYILNRVNVPVILLDSNSLNINANYVVLDNVMGTYKASQYLIRMGHSKIGYLKSSIPIVNFNERYEGYRKALEENGMEIAKENTYLLMPSMDGAYKDMIEHLAKNPELPTAFVADNDLIAMGAVKAFKEKGIGIPERVSIIGFDDMPFCSMTEPTLTTIKVNKKEFGRMGVDNLIGIIEGKNKCFCKTVLGVDLVERNSVKDMN
jgi:LacI family transcriptional regulator